MQKPRSSQRAAEIIVDGIDWSLIEFFFLCALSMYFLCESLRFEFYLNAISLLIY
jgi:hypothetical protein